MSDKNNNYKMNKIKDLMEDLKISYSDAYIVYLLEEISYKLYLLQKEKTGTKEK